MEEVPVKTKKPRKRSKYPDEWKRNVSKRRRQQGESYISSRGKTIPAVSMKDSCPASCRRKCNERISNEERLIIFRRYYQLEAYERKRDFIHSHTEKKHKKWHTLEISKRENTIVFLLPRDNERIQVCKTMFINTLGIRKGVVDIAMKKRTLENTSLEDKRGKHIQKVTSPEILESVKQRIEKFPVMSSHYCRAKTQRKYLASDINITVMYSLYKEERIKLNLPAATTAIYQKVFCEEYNLGFHRPRKDQCRICMAYNIPTSDKSAMETRYQAHIAAKDRAREEKRSSKQLAENSNGKLISCNFDLQQVLLVPNDPKNNALFYKQRLKTFNFTVYDVVSKQGDCFMWTEVEGKRGSSEIASCLYTYFKSLPNSVERISCFSDRCGGQNLNKFVAAMCLTAVQEIPHLENIDLMFLVSEHSEMECDSMHSAISTELKRVGKANWPLDWKTIARSARRKGDKPYIVHDITHEQILDWKVHAEQNMIFRKEDENRNPVGWQKFCWINFSKSRPLIMRFKEKFDEDFRILNCNRKTRRHSSIASTLKPLYQNQLAIKKEKYNDLLSLFQMNPPALPSEYKPYFKNLPFQGNKRKNNQESSESELSDIDE